MPERYPRSFRGIWVPAKLWKDTSLTVSQRVILAEIESLDNPPRHCFAGNDHFCEIFGFSNSTVSAAIAELMRRSLISLVEFDGRVRVLKSHAGPYYIDDDSAIQNSDGRYQDIQNDEGRSRKPARQASKKQDVYKDEVPKSIHTGSEPNSPNGVPRTPKPQRVVDLSTVPQSVIETAKAAITARGVHIKNWESPAARGTLKDEVARMEEQ